MKVVFLQSLAGTAVAGEIREVRNGFLRNYLLPRGVAVPASEKIIQETEHLREEQKRKQEQKVSNAKELLAKLKETTLEFSGKSGDEKHLYAAITEKDIFEKLESQFEFEFDKKAIKHQSFKTVGDFQVPIRLADGINGIVKISITASAE